MRFAVLLAAALILTPATCLADEPPSGIPWLVGGSLAMGAGVVNMVGAGLCIGTLPQVQRVPCAATSIGFGVAGLAIGIPLVIVGADKRSVWRAWIERVTIRPALNGAAVGFRGAF
jgi:hypothetical protein